MPDRVPDEVSDEVPDHASGHGGAPPTRRPVGRLADVGTGPGQLADLPLAEHDETEQSGHMTRDDDGRSPDSGGSPVGGEPFDWRHFTVPDDLQELQGDIRAYRREQRAKARARLFRRLLLWDRFGVAGPVVLAAFLLVVGFISLMVLFPVRQRHVAGPEPLATPVRAVGEEGGLVPDLPITPAHGNPRTLRSFRPAVVMLVPEHCPCADRVRSVARSADRHRVLTVLVSSTPPAAPREVGGEAVVRAADPDGALASRFHVTDRPVLLLVRPDGVINRILVDVPSQNALDGELVVIAERGQPR